MEQTAPTPAPNSIIIIDRKGRRDWIVFGVGRDWLAKSFGVPQFFLKFSLCFFISIYLNKMGVSTSMTILFKHILSYI